MFNRSIKSDETPHDGAPPGERTTDQAILEAAERLFLEKGFARTSTTEIAKEAGCNQALVHYYYRTKDRLFESIFERKAKLLLSGFLQIHDESLPFEQVLAGMVRSHFDMLAQNPRIPVLIVNELLTNPERLRALREKLGPLPAGIAKGLQKRLDLESAKGSIRPTLLVDLFFTILGLNALPFLAGPILKTATEMSDAEFDSLLRRRRAENVRIVLASLRPDSADSSPVPDRKHGTKAGRTAKGSKA